LSKIKDAFNSSIKIPFFSPSITKDDKKAVLYALASTLLTDGPKLREFEKNFAKFTGAKFAIGVSNATSALHLSLKALGIGRGDEVIVPDMTFVATANAVVHSNATPVFADVEMDTMNISVDSIKDKITSKTRAVLPVHFAGRACNIDEITKLAKKNAIPLIEDCAHAIGTRYHEKHVGNFGIVGCFSFYPTKNITTIEGGMIITNSRDVAKYVMSARNHGLSKNLMERYNHGMPWDYDMKESGYNYRLDEIRSSLGINQLKRIKILNVLRKNAFEYYNAKLADIPDIITPSLPNKWEEHAYHLYILRIKENDRVSRDELFRKLLNFGIRTSVHYKPLHEFSAFKKLKHCDLDNSTQLYSEIISLPFYPDITKKQQDYVISCIRRIMSNSL